MPKPTKMMRTKISAGSALGFLMARLLSRTIGSTDGNARGIHRRPPSPRCRRLRDEFQTLRHRQDRLCRAAPGFEPVGEQAPYPSLRAQRSNRASVRTSCQRGASPRRMEPYHVKPRVTASSTVARAGFALLRWETGWGATGGECVARRLTNPFRRDGAASLRL